EATAFQTREVLDAMIADAESDGVELSELKVDGGMVMHETHMQFQADILGVPVVRPNVIETTARGAAYAAGIAVGFWQGEQDVMNNWSEHKRWEPSMDEQSRARLLRLWKKAIERTLDWVDEDVEALHDGGGPFDPRAGASNAEPEPTTPGQGDECRSRASSL